MSDLATSAASMLAGTVRVQSDNYEYRTSFSSGLRFRCLPGCGLCCRTYRIPLTRSDLDRLQEVVEPEACQNIAFADPGQECGTSAFMENGKAESCCYLDGHERCSVYGNRPLYCRTYPLIRETYEHLEMSVDRTCPGVGEGEPVRSGQIEEAFLLEAQMRPGALKVIESSDNYRLICSSLSAMGVYADAEIIRSVCAGLIGRGLSRRRDTEILSYFGAAAAALARLLAGTGNINDPQTAGRLVGSVEESLDGKAAETTGNELSEDATRSLAEYLSEWILRQALLRFVHATALARPRRENVLHPFFSFLVHGASEILACAGGLKRQEGGQRITQRLMKEAIRRNEGPLRSKCASVVSR
jgi:hypothetical protein